MAVALVAGSAGAAAAFVNVPCGAGGTGLVAAVNSVNAAGGGSINLDSGCTYSLTTRNNTVMGGNGLPVVVTPIVVNGKGATIAGNNTNFRIIAIDGTSGGALTLNGATITGGKATGMMVGGAGGGILDISGTLTLNSAVVTRNFAASAGGGIGDAFGATATLNKSEVSWNTVPSDMGSGGGGIISMAATLTLNDSTVDHNVAPGGGGIASGNGMGGGPGSSITLNKSVISNNTAANGIQSGGGGISNGGTLVSNNSQIVDNHAVGGEVGAGLLNHVTATLNKTIVSGNTATEGSLGGGIVNAIFFAGQPTPTMVINNSQVTGNSADGGGGGIVNVSFDPTVSAGTVTLHHTNVNGNNPDNCEPPGAVAGCVG